MQTITVSGSKITWSDRLQVLGAVLEEEVDTPRFLFMLFSLGFILLFIVSNFIFSDDFVESWLNLPFLLLFIQGLVFLFLIVWTCSLLIQYKVLIIEEFGIFTNGIVIKKMIKMVEVVSCEVSVTLEPAYLVKYTFEYDAVKFINTMYVNERCYNNIEVNSEIPIQFLPGNPRAHVVNLRKNF